MKIPILSYHSAQVDGLAYTDNDHLALCEDLRMLTEAGFRIVPLEWVVDWLLGERPDADLRDAVAITFDDGCSLDYRDLEHPTWGTQRSFFGILSDFRESFGSSRQPTLHATTFVIASPEARRALGRILAGPEWISDDWWADAAASDLLSVENHSWDHNHPVAEEVCQRNQEKGRFDNIETFDECDREVFDAAEYIASKTGVWPRFFAYPWGQSSAYLRDDYLPSQVERHRCRAAFSAHDGFVTRESNVWSIPRLVFRANWVNEAGFRELLREARP